MLTHYANKLLGTYATRAAGPLPADAPRGRCPGCGAVGPLVIDQRGGKPRPVVFGCYCPYPPNPEPLESRP